MRLFLTVGVLTIFIAFSEGQVPVPKLAFELDPNIYRSERAPNGDRYYCGGVADGTILGDSTYEFGSYAVAPVIGKYSDSQGWIWSICLISYGGYLDFSLAPDGSLFVLAQLEHQAVFGGIPINNIGQALMIAKLDPTNGNIIQMDVLPGAIGVIQFIILPNNSIVFTGILNGMFPAIGANENQSGGMRYFMFSYKIGEGVEWSTVLEPGPSVYMDIYTPILIEGGDLVVNLDFLHAIPNQTEISFLDQVIEFSHATQGGIPLAVVVRFTQEGEVVWMKTADQNSVGYFGGKLSLDHDGLPLLFGKTVDTVLVDGISIPPADNLMIGFDLNGTLSYHHIVDSDLLEGYVYPMGDGKNLVVTYHSTAYHGTHIGSFEFPEVSGNSIFLAELLENGEYTWVHHFNNSNSLGGFVDIASDGTFELILLTSGQLTFQGTPLGPPLAAYMTQIYHYSDECMGILTGPVISADCPTGDDGAVQLQILGGIAPFTYDWSNGATTEALQGVGPGVYHVVVNDAAECSAEAHAYVSGPPEGAGLDLFPMAVAYPFFRPGIFTYLDIDLMNSGCQLANGTLEVELDPLIDYLTGLEENDVQNGNLLMLSIDSLTYGTAGSRELVLQANAMAQIGDSVCISITASTSANDLVPDNDHIEICYPIVNSYDPNDKQVFPSGNGSQGFIPAETRLTYLIRFQNTGNAPAFDVFIDDTLDIDLDIMDLQVHHSSHPMYLQILNDRVLRFRFDNINLPDSLSDEANSHGYLSYSIPVMPALAGGTTIENTAYIYFDLNPPVVTNTTLNTIDLDAEIHERVVTDRLHIWPNPVTDQLFISVPASLKGNGVLVSDMQGRIIYRTIASNDQEIIDTRHWAAGIYAVSVGDRVARVVK